MDNTSIQILLCGVGGQGINGAVRSLHEHCLSEGWHCVSAVYKGGAQRLGSVKAEIRLFPPHTQQVELKSSQIIPGSLDALVVLEQWEGLRNIPLCHEQTLFLIDAFVEFPPGNRQANSLESEPNNHWSNYNNPQIRNNYQAIALSQMGHKKYAALCMLNDLFVALALPLKPIKK